MANAPLNPLAGLILPTTQRAKREADIEQFSGGNPWVRMASIGGLDVADLMRGKGYGLSNDDRQAVLNQSILNTAGAKYQDYLKAGKSIDEAQLEVLSDAIGQFSAGGNAEAANALLPAYSVLRNKMAEAEKLKSVAAKNEADAAAKPVLTASTVNLNEAKANQANANATYTAGAKTDLTNSQVGLTDAKTVTEQARPDLIRAQAEQARARAHKFLTDGAPNADGSAPLDKIQLRQASTEYRVKTNAWADSLNLFSRMEQIMRSDPGAITKGGELTTQVRGIAASVKAVLGEEKLNEDESKYSRLVQTSIKNDQLQSLTWDLAYTIARANDPGGRLSDKDVEAAIKIVRGSDNPEGALATIRGYVTGIQSRFKTLDSTWGEKAGVRDPIFKANYEKALRDYNASASPPPRTPPAKGMQWVGLKQADGSIQYKQMTPAQVEALRAPKKAQ